MSRPGALMDAVTNPAERVSRNGLALVRLRVPKGTRSVPMSERLTARVMLDDHVRVDDAHRRKRIPFR